MTYLRTWFNHVKCHNKYLSTSIVIPLTSVCSSPFLHYNYIYLSVSKINILCNKATNLSVFKSFIYIYISIIPFPQGNFFQGGGYSRSISNSSSLLGYYYLPGYYKEETPSLSLSSFKSLFHCNDQIVLPPWLSSLMDNNYSWTVFRLYNFDILF